MSSKNCSTPPGENDDGNHDERRHPVKFDCFLAEPAQWDEAPGYVAKEVQGFAPHATFSDVDDRRALSHRATPRMQRRLKPVYGFTAPIWAETTRSSIFLPGAQSRMNSRLSSLGVTNTCSNLAARNMVSSSIIVVAP